MLFCLKLRGRGTYFCGLLLAAILLLSAFASAQEDQTPKFELFTGYQWLNPGGKVPTVAGTYNNPVQQPLPSLPKGVDVSLTYFFQPHLGLEGDLGRSWTGSADETTGSVGPHIEFRQEHLNVFAHAMVSWNQLTPPTFGARSGIGAIVGGGIDLQATSLLGIRLVGADWVFARHNFSDEVAPQFPDLRRVTLQGARLSAGLVWNLGYPTTATPAASCTVQPSEVMVGEPITANAAASNFNPKHSLTYAWSSTGGKISGKNNTASIDTNGVAGGQYTVSAQITDPKTKGGVASCTANFTVKEPPKNPPNISCSADPMNVQAGTKSNISCTCSSPDNQPVTVGHWTATAGSVSGSGNTATLNTAGASPGTIIVTASCSDPRGLSAQASANVTVENPPPPTQPTELEKRLALHSIYFVTAQPTVANPKGGLLASQQQTLIVLGGDFEEYLQTHPDAHLILTGHADKRGSVAYNQALSERRVNRTKEFLVSRGVPAANIDVKALGDQHNLTAEEVKGSVEQNPELTPEERARIVKNITTILYASNRRVDITLSTTGQQSVRQFPFNAADSLTLIGGREGAKKAPAPAKKKAAPKKQQ